MGPNNTGRQSERHGMRVGHGARAGNPYTEGWYHVMSRCNGGETLYRTQNDRRRFRGLVRELARRRLLSRPKTIRPEIRVCPRSSSCRDWASDPRSALRINWVSVSVRLPFAFLRIGCSPPHTCGPGLPRFGREWGQLPGGAGKPVRTFLRREVRSWPRRWPWLAFPPGARPREPGSR